MANMRQMGAAIQMYAGQYKGSLPIGFVQDGFAINDNATFYHGESLDWTTLLTKMLSQHADIGYNNGNVSAGTAGVREIFLCPSVYHPSDVPNAVLTHYSCHPRLMPDTRAVDWLHISITPNPLLRPYKLARIRRTAEIAAIFEGTIENGSYMAHSTCDGLNRRGLDRKPYLTDNYALSPTQIDGNTPVDMSPTGGTTVDINTDGPKNPGNIRFRHNGDTTTNVLMLDGHVETFSLKKSTKTTNMQLKNISLPPT